MPTGQRLAVQKQRSLVRMGVDIGGTFTDVALEAHGRLWSAKVSTTPDAPECGVMRGVGVALEQAKLALAQVDLLVHGTTLPTNALIERRGARTALVTTEGFRDLLEMGNEGRFDQYDLRAVKPAPLVPREWRLTVPERIRVDGSIERPLDEGALIAIADVLKRERIESLAICFLHAYRDGTHERRAGQIIRSALPELSISLSHETSPQMREYERLSTVCANAYIQPLMGRYLATLDAQLREMGLQHPMMMILSSGGLSTLETAVRFPIRLVESGPAGGAIFASLIAQQAKRDAVLSFDLGGTTAKFCLIDKGRARMAVGFEVGRTYRFKRGSGLPVRIPVVDLVEIGAGGGSIARLDAVGRIIVGPESAGSEPGPACYARGGSHPTITDCDLVMGKLDAATFAGGAIRLDISAAQASLSRSVARPAGIGVEPAAFAVTETVAETMAAAARVHAAECGAEMRGRSMVAFGGAAPLHAARFAERLGVGEIIIPVGASVGSAIGFLWAPVAYEVARSVNAVLELGSFISIRSALDAAECHSREIVRRALGPNVRLRVRRAALMRYAGQGHEIEVTIPAAPSGVANLAQLRGSYERVYRRNYGRVVPDAPIEVTTISVIVSGPARRPSPNGAARTARPARPCGTRRVYDPQTRRWAVWPVFERASLAGGTGASGPAVIVEPDTTTIVPRGFRFRVDGSGYLILKNGNERHVSAG